MEPFIIYKAKAIAIMEDNIDTDILIPKEYLKSISKTGFEDWLFAPWRYDQEGREIKEFSLNIPQNKGAGILITGENFGCGSSREHAAWALQDYGFHVIVAGGYSDIFYGNWLNNGHLPIVLSKEERDTIVTNLEEELIEINLKKQILKLKEYQFRFEIPEDWKDRLLRGKDHIDITMEYEDKIEAYERRKAE